MDNLTRLFFRSIHENVRRNDRGHPWTWTSSWHGQKKKKQPPYSSIAEREKKYSSFLNPPLGVLAFFDHIPTTTTTQLTDLLIYTPHTHTHTQTPDSIRIYQKKTESNRNAKQKKINQLHTQYTLMNINQTKPKKGTWTFFFNEEKWFTTTTTKNGKKSTSIRGHRTNRSTLLLLLARLLLFFLVLALGGVCSISLVSRS